MGSLPPLGRSQHVRLVDHTAVAGTAQSGLSTRDRIAAIAARNADIRGKREIEAELASHSADLAVTRFAHSNDRFVVSLVGECQSRPKYCLQS